MFRLYSLLIGYVFGNILFAMVVGKFLLHKNPTQFGSKNPGTANVGAVFGKKYGIITCIGDLSKTLIALLIVFFLYHGNHDAIAFCGLGVVLGHCFPIWHHFSGGKGVAVSIIWILFFDFWPGIVALLVGLFLVIIMKDLTWPPIIFMLGYSLYVGFTINWYCGGVFLLGTVVMIFKYRNDIVAYFKGQGKKVDILTTIKKKLGKKVS